MNNENKIDEKKVSEEMIQMVEKIESEKEEKEKEKIIKGIEKAEKEKVIFKDSSDEEIIKTPTQIALEKWVPKTELGKNVKSGKVKNIDEIFNKGLKILEPEIVDSLLVLNTELLNIGQAKGKFGGGKRRSWRQTQKKTKDKNVVTFTVMAVVGDGNGHVGVGMARAAETMPAKEKAIRKAKLNIMKVKRGCASFDCSCNDSHSIPFETNGKCASAKVRFMPAPQGTGLVVGNEVKKIMRLAGIQDIYGKSLGQTGTTINLAKATVQALTKLGDMRE